MGQNTSAVKDLTIGDLVTHLLYGKEWVGVVLGFKAAEYEKSPRGEKSLVQIQPGTKYEGFFGKNVSSKDRVNDNLGYVTTNWLFKIEIKDAKFRPSRDET